MIFFGKLYNHLLIKRKQFHMTSKNRELLIWNLSPSHIYMTLYAFLTLIAVLYCIIYSFYSQEFIIPMWHPKKLHSLLFYSQWIWSCFLSVIGCAEVCFFNAICYEVYLQFKILNQNMKNALKKHIKRKEIVISKELKDIVHYHRFLIR